MKIVNAAPPLNGPIRAFIRRRFLGYKPRILRRIRGCLDPETIRPRSLVLVARTPDLELTCCIDRSLGLAVEKGEDSHR